MREGDRQQDIKEEFVALCSFRPQPQLLYILNLFMYKCLSPLLRAGPTESPKSLWKGDTINSLSRHSLFMLTMLFATQCNFECIKKVQLNRGQKDIWLEVDCFVHVSKN